MEQDITSRSQKQGGIPCGGWWPRTDRGEGGRRKDGLVASASQAMEKAIRKGWAAGLIHGTLGRPTPRRFTQPT
jgi:hypothetical protein